MFDLSYRSKEIGKVLSAWEFMTQTAFLEGYFVESYTGSKSHGGYRQILGFVVCQSR